MQFGTAERETGNREWRRPREFPKGALTACTALSSFFIDNFTHLHCAARVANLNSLVQLNHHYSLPTYSQQNSLDVGHLCFNKIKKPLMELAVVRLKELNADKEVCEEVAQQTETAALSMQVNLQTPPSSDVPVHLMIPSLSAPLPKTCSSSSKGRFCTPLKDPE